MSHAVKRCGSTLLGRVNTTQSARLPSAAAACFSSSAASQYGETSGRSHCYPKSSSFYGASTKSFHSGTPSLGQRIAEDAGLKGGQRTGLLAGFAGLVGLGGLAYWQMSEPNLGAQCKSISPPEKKLIKKEEVAKHNSAKTRIWVTYKDGVYDITEFVALHPGGASRIMLAAGGAVDPFWAMYRQHQTDQVKAMLEEYRIGTLEGYSAAKSAPLEDPYAKDPPRHPSLIPRSENPCNAETPNELLAGSLLTPTDLFFVRNHLPVPVVDPKEYKLRIEGEGLRTVELSLSDLRKTFRKYTVPATVQCSGNRRQQMSDVKPVKGLAWDAGAIGTASWSGARLRDILKYAGLDEDDIESGEVEHIQFEGLDADISGDCYGASIPAPLAINRQGDVLLAYEMNGQELPPDHGYPVRVVVPGVTGARSVKWLSKIIASKQESTSHWQQNDYKSFSPSVDWDSVDWGSAPALQDTPVQSAICEPAPGSVIEPDEGHITVRGYAFSGGGRGIIRVDVTADGGKTWTSANLEQLPHQKPLRQWAWSLWEARVPVPSGGVGSVELACKAVDGAYNNQPDSVAPIWNIRGIVNNAWHRVPVTIAADE